MGRDLWGKQLDTTASFRPTRASLVRIAAALVLGSGGATIGPRSADAAERTVIVRSWPNGKPAAVQVWDGQQRLRDEQFDESGRRVMLATWSADGRRAEWQQLRPDGTVEGTWATEDGQRHGEEVGLDLLGRRIRVVPWVKGRRHGRIQEFDADGKLSSEIPYANDAPVGPMVTYYPTGERRSVCPLSDHRRHGVEILYAAGGWRMGELPYLRGVLHGKARYFDEQGRLSAEVPYQSGQAAGPELQYYPSGKKRMVVPMTAAGLRHGRAQHFEESGALIGELPFDQGQLQGWEWRYGPNGARIAEVEWRAGQACCAVKTLWPSGAIQNLREFVDLSEDGTETRFFDGEAGKAAARQMQVGLRKGKKHGAAQLYAADGHRWGELPFEDDLRHGRERRFYPDGEVEAEYQWQFDKRVGNGRTFWPNGQLQSDFPADVEGGTGLERRWTPEGKLRMEVPLVQGKKHGEAKLFDTTGAVISRLTYADDRLNGPETRFRNGRKIGVWSWKDDELVGEPQLELVQSAEPGRGGSAKAKPVGKAVVVAEADDAKADADLVRERARGAANPVQADAKGPHGEGKAGNDKSQGAVAVYWPNGKVRSVHPARGRGTEVQFHDNGEVAAVAMVVDGTRQGLARFFDRSGVLLGQVRYADGLKDGDEIRFGRAGERVGLYPFRRGAPVGIARTWYRDGSPQSEFHHDPTLPAGTEMQYHKNGQMRLYVPLRFGKRHGTATVYDDRGLKWAEVPWVQGAREGDELRFDAKGKAIGRLRWHADRQLPASAEPASPGVAPKAAEAVPQKGR